MSVPSHKNTQLASQQKKPLLFVVLIIALSVLLIGAALAAFFFLQPNKNEAKQALGDIVAPRSVEQETKHVESQLGFKAEYNESLINARGQVTTSAKNGIIEGLEYSGSDLEVPRSYNIATFTPKAPQDEEQSVSFASRVDLTILTSAREQYFEPRRAQYPGLSDTEITVREFTPKDAVLASREKETINNIEYEKLHFEFRTATGVVTLRMLRYVTVQHGRPFVLSLFYSASAKAGDLTPLMQVISTVSYNAPSSDAEYLTDEQAAKTSDGADLLNASVTLGASQTVNAPSTLREGTDLSIVAKNQLAVVRVATIYCYDFSMLTKAGTIAQDFTGSCTAGSGSGSIVRADGMVSTNGHVTVLSLRETILGAITIHYLNRDETGMRSYINGLSAMGAISAAEVTPLVNDIMAGKEEAYEQITALISNIPDSQLKIKKQGGEYAIQLSDTPVRLNIKPEGLSFNYGKTIVKASFIAANYDATIESIIESRASDVALLDINEGDSFPVVHIGNLKDVTEGAVLTVVGFPGFVDGGLATKQETTVPTATQGKLLDTEYDKGGYLLGATNVPLAQGNSGGPAFNADGEQVGVATYAILSATDAGLGKTKLSKESLIRDVADFTALARKSNITFDGSSRVNETWYGAIDAFASADYGKATSLLASIDAAYKDHYLVASLADIANTQQNKASFSRVVAISLLVAIPLLITALITCIVMVVRQRRVPPPAALAH